MKRIPKIGPTLCFVLAIIALGLWPLSYKRSIGVAIPLGKSEIVLCSFNGNLYNEVEFPIDSYGRDWMFQFNTDLAQPDSEEAQIEILTGDPDSVFRQFGKPIFEIFRDPDFTGWSIQLPHWTVALIFLPIGTLWQIFGNRPDDADESD